MLLVGWAATPTDLLGQRYRFDAANASLTLADLRFRGWVKAALSPSRRL